MEEFEGVAKDRAEGSPGSQTVLPLPQAQLNQADFLCTLFRALDEQGVRYCVLHSYERLPNELQSDLDLAAHPRDAIKLQFVFQILREKGYSLVQSLNYEMNSYQFIFTWFEALVLRYVVLDVIFEYREGALLLAAGEKMVANRQRRSDFWIPHSATEFAYLLAKKTLKGSVPPHQRERFKLLVRELGRNEAEQVAAGLFGKRWAPLVVEAAADGVLEKLVSKLQTLIWQTNLERKPLNLIRHLLNEARRSLGRWFHPTGLFIAVLGPDGVGKTTLIGHLTQSFGPAFRRQVVFHWRPGFLWREKDTGVVEEPHRLPPRSTWLSVAILFGRLLDYWLGYAFIIRPFLARSGLVVFDRYFNDVLTDPKRYRYGGPQWLPRVLGRLIPKADLSLFLDAPEDVILSRKQEVAPEEIRRQRSAYLKWAQEFSSTCVLDATRPIPEVSSEARRAVVQALDSRYSPRLRAEEEGAQTEGRLKTTAADSPAALLRNALDQFLGQRSWSSPAGEGKEAPVPHAIDFGDVSVVHFESVKEGVPSKNGGRTHRFVILPSSKSPRLLLPLGDPETTLRGLQIYAPCALAARMAKNLLAGAIQLSWQGLGCHRISVTSQGPLPLEGLIREVTGETRPVFALLLGTPGLYRKMAIQVMRPRGETLGFLKLPLTQPAVDKIRHEADMLKRLSSFACLRAHIPQVLYAGEWANGYVLFQTGGLGRMGPIEFGPLHEKFLQTLWSVQHIEKPGHVLVEDAARQWSEAQPLLGTEWRELGKKALEHASHDLAGRRVPCGISHGDFAPWNTRTDNQRLFVHDWELAAWEAPLGWDRFQFHALVSRLLGRGNGLPANLERAPHESAVFLLYLLDSLCLAVKEGAALGDGVVGFHKRLLAAVLR